MIPFSDCRRCMEAPRESPRFWGGAESVKAYPDMEAMHRMPESLGLIGGRDGLWKCPDCGTYYGFDVFSRGWPQGSCQTTLWRLTPAEAMEKYRWPREGSWEGEELRRFQERLPEWIREMQACLRHSDPAVRERAAHALGSHFRAQSEWAGVTALLDNADASIRRGAVLAFDSIRFVSSIVSLESHPAHIVTRLVKLLMDRDASVARQAFVLLSRAGDRKYRERILQQVSAIPIERRTAAARMFSLSAGGSFQELVAGLADSEEEVRQIASSTAYEHSQGDTGFVTRLRAALRAIPEADRTREMSNYLCDENPEGADTD
jgi:hypothetical protein